MRRRFNCVDGKVAPRSGPGRGEFQSGERAHAPEDGKRQTKHARKPVRRGHAPDVAAKARPKPQASPKTQSRCKRRSKPPESPWDTRLQHHWVSAYRRIHDKSDQPTHPESPWDPRLRHPWVWAYRRVHGNRQS